MSPKQSGTISGWFIALLATLLVFGENTVVALTPDDAGVIPHVSRKAKEGFADYLFAGDHRAFVIAPGGTWSWSADQATREVALPALYTAALCALRDR